MNEAKNRKPNFPIPFKRKTYRPRANKIIAYDLETTRIEAGSPDPLYVTMYGVIKDGHEQVEYRVAERLASFDDLLEVLATQFLLPELHDVKFVAWNGNNFDIYLIAKALLLDNRYVMRPYLTRSKSLRGMRVYDQQTLCEYEFLDGIAMTGCVMTLEKFLKVFAPEYQKLTGVIDFDREEFNSRNHKHCEYAMRDSVGLWHALMEAQRIINESFNHVLTPTIGNLGIKIFQQYLPLSAAIQPLTDEVDNVVRRYVMRGGFCYCARQFTGRVWKYDINQAYAAAMREAWLPDGYADRVSKYWARYPGIYRVRALNGKNRIPFYYRDNSGDAVFGMTDITDTWITSSEYEQLKSEGWAVKVLDGYIFGGRFKMQEYVDTLEHLRMNAPGGTNGAKGLMMKAIGNNSYGKTVEQLDGVEYVMCNECPEGYLALVSSEPGQSDLPIWIRQGELIYKDYHKPQIGAFITAHVRMVVRRAALLAPDAWLYADTDCTVFTKPVNLDIDPSRYGAWKVECEGERYRIITKKVYAKVYDEQTARFSDMTPDEQRAFLKQFRNEQHSKGLNVKKLTNADFEAWARGIVPEQQQLHRNNIMKVLAGAEMYIEQVRKGTKIKPKK